VTRHVGQDPASEIPARPEDLVSPGCSSGDHRFHDDAIGALELCEAA
jgi:hypothetical protein